MDSLIGKKLWEYKRRTHRSWYEVGLMFAMPADEAKRRAWEWAKTIEDTPPETNSPKNGLQGASNPFMGIGVALESFRQAAEKIAGISDQFSPDSISLPEAVISESIEPALKAEDPNILILGDLHCPYHNVQTIRRAILVTQQLYPHVDQVAFIGDFWDFATISRYAHTRHEANVDQALDIGGDLIDAITEWFKVGYFVPGNHDRRLSQKLDQPFHLKRLVYAALEGRRLDCEIRVTNRDYMLVGDNWLIGHPSKYSGQGAKTPAEIADLEGRNVVTGHNHRVGMAYSKSGKYLGIDNGHCTDPALHPYISESLNTFARWNAGFTVISNGYPYQYSDQATDWESLGID